MKLPCFVEGAGIDSSYLLECTQDDSKQLKSIRPGLPRFLESGSRLHFKLIKEWIQFCNEGERSRGDGRCPEPSRMPKRVVDVGDGRTVHVVLTDEDKIGQEHWVALS